MTSIINLNLNVIIHFFLESLLVVRTSLMTNHIKYDTILNFDFVVWLTNEIIDVLIDL